VGVGAAALCLGVFAHSWRALPRRPAPPAAVPRAPRASVTDLRPAHLVAVGGRSATRLIAIYAVAVGIAYGVPALLPLVLMDTLGSSALSAAWWITYLGGFGVVVRALALGPIVDRLGEVRSVRTGLACIAGCVGLLAHTTTHVSLLAALSLLALGTALTFPPLGSLLSQLVPAERRGYVLSLQQTAGGVGRAAFPILAGVALEATTMGGVFAASAVVLIVLAPFTAALVPPPAAHRAPRWTGCRPGTRERRTASVRGAGGAECGMRSARRRRRGRGRARPLPLGGPPQQRSYGEVAG
jgi:MFS family permease